MVPTRFRSLFALCAAVALGAASSARAQGAAGPWRKFVSQNGSFSLHYPEGWTASEKGAAVILSRAAAHEDVLVLGLQYDEAKTPAQFAESVFAFLRPNAPDLRITSSQGNTTAAIYDLTLTSDGRRLSAVGMAIKQAGQAVWLSYSAPVQAFDRAFGIELIRGVVSSIAKGAGSRPPKLAGAAAPSARVPDGPGAAAAQESGTVVGSWGTSAVYGSVVTRTTGEYQRVSSFGESWTFGADGHFGHLIVGSGTMISGSTLSNGDYKVEGDRLTLHVTRTQWTPSSFHSGQSSASTDEHANRVERYRWHLTGGKLVMTDEHGITTALPRVRE